MKIIDNRYFVISLILIIIFYLFYSNLIYDYFVAQDSSKYIGLYRDWIITLDDTYCEIGNNSDCRPYQYGPSLLYIPFPDLFKSFYYLILPNLMIIFFVISIFYIFKNYYNKNKLLIFLLIFSPTSLIALERGNLDLHLFLLAILICYNRYFYLNLLLISFSFLLKYYPLTFFPNIFTENTKTRKIQIISFVSTIFISLLIVFFHREVFMDLFNNLSASKAGYHLIYSVKTIAKILKYLFSLNYIFLLLVTYIVFIYIIIKLIKYHYKINLDKKISLVSIEEKLFLIGANTSLFAYVLFSNVFYREIFLILTIPLLLKLKDEFEDFKIFKFLLYFIIFRYLFLHVHNYSLLTDNHFYVDGMRVFYNSFLFTLGVKSFLDYFFMALLGSIVFLQNYKILRILLGKL